jgi:NTE family protein
MPTTYKHTGLVLSGGGARAAYQVGVLRAISDILPAYYPNPFDIICGTSAGGLNAAGLATHASCLQDGVKMLETVWGDFHTNQVYRTDWPGVLARAGRFLWTLAFGRMRQDLPISLLDNSPLRSLMEQHLAMHSIQDAIDAGHLRALCITASGYSSGESVSFFQGARHLDNWRRARRIGIRATINHDHLMASAAIPIFFPSVHINREYFGDGALRQLSPISPALHLGADRVLVIGVGGQTNLKLRENKPVYPSIAQVVGHIMNSSFIDSLEADIERLTRINRTLNLIPDEVRKQHSTLKHIDTLVISPAAEILDTLALKHAALLPKSIRLFIKGSEAAKNTDSSVLSYLLFEAPYCRDLMNLGYHDALHRRLEIQRFFGIEEQHKQQDTIPNNVISFKRDRS